MTVDTQPAAFISLMWPLNTYRAIKFIQPFSMTKVFSLLISCVSVCQKRFHFPLNAFDLSGMCETLNKS